MTRGQIALLVASAAVLGLLFWLPGETPNDGPLALGPQSSVSTEPPGSSAALREPQRFADRGDPPAPPPPGASEPADSTAGRAAAVSDAPPTPEDEPDGPSLTRGGDPGRPMEVDRTELARDRAAALWRALGWGSDTAGDAAFGAWLVEWEVRQMDVLAARSPAERAAAQERTEIWLASLVQRFGDERAELLKRRLGLETKHAPEVPGNRGGALGVNSDG